MTNLTTYTAGVGDAPLLGYLAWYTVFDNTMIPYKDLENALDQAGLGYATPRPPKAKDVFRRSCTSHEKRREPVSKGVYENHLIRDVRSIGGAVDKHLVIERVDTNGRRLDYTPVYELSYNDKNGAYATSLHPSASEYIHVAESVITTFRQWQDKVHSQAVRTAILRVLQHQHATVVRPSGGVYFISSRNVDDVHGMEQVLTGLTGTKGASIHTVPLVDNPRQREMLEDAFKNEMENRLSDLMADVDQAIDAGKVGSKKFSNLASELSDIKSKAREYTSVLESEQEAVSLRVQAFESKLSKLYQLQLAE